MEDLKKCPNCGSSNVVDCYIYIRCDDCKMTGPKMNNGNMDEHCDYIDNINAIKAWNKLPR